MTTLFSAAEATILLKLLIAHLLTDFFWQPSKWVNSKHHNSWSSPHLYYHCLFTGLVAWILLADLSQWWAVAIITAMHTIIDGLKNKITNAAEKNTPDKAEFAVKALWLFIADQILHLIVIILVWLAMIHGFERFAGISAGNIISPQLLLYVLGYLLMFHPAGYSIAFITKRWNADLNMEDSLKDAGKWIGMLERVLVISFIFINQLSLIGFLIAGKSILRLTDRPDKPIFDPESKKPFSPRKHTEYVLIGTFLSIGIAFGTGLLIKYFLEVWGFN